MLCKTLLEIKVKVSKPEMYATALNYTENTTTDKTALKQGFPKSDNVGSS